LQALAEQLVADGVKTAVHYVSEDDSECTLTSTSCRLPGDLSYLSVIRTLGNNAPNLQSESWDCTACRCYRTSTYARLRIAQLSVL
jgi:hypothetical protein